MLPRKFAKARRLNAEIPWIALRERPHVEHAHGLAVAHRNVDPAGDRHTIADRELIDRPGFRTAVLALDEDRVIARHANRTPIAGADLIATLRRGMTHKSRPTRRLDLPEAVERRSRRLRVEHVLGSGLEARLGSARVDRGGRAGCEARRHVPDLLASQFPAVIPEHLLVRE